MHYFASETCLCYLFSFMYVLKTIADEQYHNLDLYKIKISLDMLQYKKFDTLNSPQKVEEPKQYLKSHKNVSRLDFSIYVINACYYIFRCQNFGCTNMSTHVCMYVLPRIFLYIFQLHITASCALLFTKSLCPRVLLFKELLCLVSVSYPCPWPSSVGDYK